MVSMSMVEHGIHSIPVLHAGVKTELLIDRASRKNEPDASLGTVY